MNDEIPDDVVWANEREPHHTCYARAGNRAMWLTQAEYDALMRAGATVAGEGVAS